MAYCPSCGAELQENSNFCPRCGIALSGDSRHTSSDPRFSNAAKAACAVAGVAVGASILSGLLWRRRRRPPFGPMGPMGPHHGPMGGPHGPGRR